MIRKSVTSLLLVAASACQDTELNLRSGDKKLLIEPAGENKFERKESDLIQPTDSASSPNRFEFGLKAELITDNRTVLSWDSKLLLDCVNCTASLLSSLSQDMSSPTVVAKLSKESGSLEIANIVPNTTTYYQIVVDDPRAIVTKTAPLQVSSPPNFAENETTPAVPLSPIIEEFVVEKGETASKITLQVGAPVAVEDNVIQISVPIESGSQPAEVQNNSSVQTPAAEIKVIAREPAVSGFVSFEVPAEVSSFSVQTVSTTSFASSPMVTVELKKEKIFDFSGSWYLARTDLNSMDDPQDPASNSQDGMLWQPLRPVASTERKLNCWIPTHRTLRIVDGKVQLNWDNPEPGLPVKLIRRFDAGTGRREQFVDLPRGVNSFLDTELQKVVFAGYYLYFVDQNCTSPIVFFGSVSEQKINYEDDHRSGFANPKINHVGMETLAETPTVQVERIENQGILVRTGNLPSYSSRTYLFRKKDDGQWQTVQYSENGKYLDFDVSVGTYSYRAQVEDTRVSRYEDAAVSELSHTVSIAVANELSKTAHPPTWIGCWQNSATGMRATIVNHQPGGVTELWRADAADNFTKYTHLSSFSDLSAYVEDRSVEISKKYLYKLRSRTASGPTDFGPINEVVISQATNPLEGVEVTERLNAPQLVGSHSPNFHDFKATYSVPEVARDCQIEIWREFYNRTQSEPTLVQTLQTPLDSRTLHLDRYLPPGVYFSYKARCRIGRLVSNFTESIVRFIPMRFPKWQTVPGEQYESIAEFIYKNPKLSSYMNLKESAAPSCSDPAFVASRHTIRGKKPAIDSGALIRLHTIGDNQLGSSSNSQNDLGLQLSIVNPKTLGYDFVTSLRPVAPYRLYYVSIPLLAPVGAEFIVTGSSSAQNCFFFSDDVQNGLLGLNPVLDAYCIARNDLNLSTPKFSIKVDLVGREFSGNSTFRVILNNVFPMTPDPLQSNHYRPSSTELYHRIDLSRLSDGTTLIPFWSNSELLGLTPCKTTYRIEPELNPDGTVRGTGRCQITDQGTLTLDEYGNLKISISCK